LGADPLQSSTSSTTSSSPNHFLPSTTPRRPHSTNTLSSKRFLSTSNHTPDLLRRKDHRP
jgi:hypothetical protein